MPSEDTVGGSAIQGPVRDTRPLLPDLVNARRWEGDDASLGAFHCCPLLRNAKYNSNGLACITDETRSQGWEEPHV